MKKDAGGTVTLYIQKDSPGAYKEANWLPALDEGWLQQSPIDLVVVVRGADSSCIPA